MDEGCLTRMSSRIIGDALVSTCLLRCAICEHDLEDVDPDYLEQFADRNSVLAHPGLVLDRQACYRCGLVWQLTHQLIDDGCEDDDRTETKLIALDVRAGFRIVFQARIRTMPNQAPQTSRTNDARGESSSAHLQKAPIAISIRTVSNRRLPNEFVALGPSQRCVSRYHAQAYLAYAAIRVAYAAFETHLADCDHCLGLMIAAQRTPLPLCPPVGVLRLAKGKILPAPLQGLVHHHVWGTEAHPPDCLCQEIWPHLRLLQI